MLPVKFLKKGPFIIFIFFITGLCGCSVIYDYPPTSSNSDCALYIKNYLGNTQNIHPKVLYFENGWRGYRFWMAYTPYPNGATDAENPCIAVSDDGLKWETPQGLINPLAVARKGGYNSDTHLVYDQFADRIECWWREYDINGNRDQICRRTSSDGVHWNEREIILPYNDVYTARLSPAIWIEDGNYKMVYSNGSRLKFSESEYGTDLVEWSDPIELPVAWNGLRAWHHDLIIGEDGDWELLVCAFMQGGNNNTADLYYVKLSPDFNNVAIPYLILARGERKSDFDNRSIYRSSMVRVKDEIYIYYSCIDKNWNRYMSLLRGYSINDLRGLSPEDFPN